MPPPMPNPAKRMTAQPSRPVQRYRPGKPVAEEESSDEEESEEEQQQQQQRVQERVRQTRPAAQQKSQAKQGYDDDEDDDDDDEEGFVTDPEDGDEEQAPQPKAKASAAAAASSASRPAPVQSRPVDQSEIKDEDEDDEDEDEDSSDEDGSDSDDSSSSSSSSASEPQRKFQRPTFIRKSDRNNHQTAAAAVSTSTADLPDQEQQQSKHRKLAEADTILREKLERDAAARAAGRRAWDDDDNEAGMAAEDMVDDTDGLDPAAEHAAWRLRELKRLKRDREALIAREAEIEELERRRQLTAEEREAEDRDFLARQREARDQNRGPARVLAKYLHKGAFFRGDDEAAEALAQRDLMGAAFEDDVADKAALPEYMRVRDMTKLGKKGRTRYKDLKTEDTGRFGDDDRGRRWDGSRKEPGAGGSINGFTAGIDERFLPDSDGRNGPRFSGANASALGSKNRTTTTTATRSERSNSPHSQSRRKRSPDRQSPDWDRDKRRRVDAVS